MTEFFCDQMLTIFANPPIIDDWLDCKYASDDDNKNNRMTSESY